MKKVFVIAMLSFCSFSYGQQNTSEKIGLLIGNYYVPQGEFEGFFKPVVRHFGLKYEYSIGSRFSLGMTYCSWHSGKKIWTYLTKVDFYSPSMNGYTERSFLLSRKKGDIERRYDYQLFDLTALYVLPIKKHVLQAGAGPSYCFGMNQYLISIYRQPGHEDWLSELGNVRANYLGIMATVSYSYELSERFNIGVSETMRYYPRMSAQYYFNVNIDYKFNLLKRLVD